jgi:hypothetical protein
MLAVALVGQAHQTLVVWVAVRQVLPQVQETTEQ